MNMKQFKEFLDEEQLDELSSDTLKKYKTAAHKAIGDAAVKQHAGKMGSKEYHAHQDKRSKGINRADADKRLGTYKDKTPKHLDISANAKSIQKDGDRYRYNEENDMCNVCGQTPCNCTHIEEESKWKVSYDVHGSNKDAPLYLSHKHVRAKSEQEAINTVKKLVGGTKHKAELVKEGVDPSEVAGNPKAYDAKTVKAAYYHKKASESDKKALARHLDSYHGPKEWRKPEKKNVVKEEQIDELSNELLDRYKKKAGEAASAADKAKDFEKGHKRFKGIVKATFKQFANDAKK